MIQTLNKPKIKICPACHSEGSIPVMRGQDNFDTIPCAFCRGKGLVTLDNKPLPEETEIDR